MGTSPGQPGIYDKNSNFAVFLTVDQLSVLSLELKNRLQIW